MKRKLATIIIAISLCFIIFQTSHAALVNVYFDATVDSVLDPLVDGVTGFEFSITEIGEPADPPGYSMVWGNIITDAIPFFNAPAPPSPAQVITVNTIESGLVATITYDNDISIVLGDWLLLDSSYSGITQDTDYFVNFNGTDTYTISANVVPIPSTILLLGGGLVALVGLRRRRS